MCMYIYRHTHTHSIDCTLLWTSLFSKRNRRTLSLSRLLDLHGLVSLIFLMWDRHWGRATKTPTQQTTSSFLCCHLQLLCCLTGLYLLVCLGLFIRFSSPTVSFLPLSSSFSLPLSRSFSSVLFRSWIHSASFSLSWSVLLYERPTPLSPLTKYNEQMLRRILTGKLRQILKPRGYISPLVTLCCYF